MVVVSTSGTENFGQRSSLFTSFVVDSSFYTSGSDIYSKLKFPTRSLCPILKIWLSGVTSLLWLSQWHVVVCEMSLSSMKLANPLLPSSKTTAPIV